MNYMKFYLHRSCSSSSDSTAGSRSLLLLPLILILILIILLLLLDMLIKHPTTSYIDIAQISAKQLN